MYVFLIFLSLCVAVCARALCRVTPWSTTAERARGGGNSGTLRTGPRLAAATGARGGGNLGTLRTGSRLTAAAGARGGGNSGTLRTGPDLPPLSGLTSENPHDSTRDQRRLSVEPLEGRNQNGVAFVGGVEEPVVFGLRWLPASPRPMPSRPRGRIAGASCHQTGACLASGSLLLIGSPP